MEQAYLGGQAVLSEQERTSGKLLYFTDFIAPYGNMKKIAQDLRVNVFPNEMGKSLRFTEPGKMRPKPFQFYGVNYRKPLN